MRKTFYLLCIVLLFAQCSMEKRLYRPGYAIDWLITNRVKSETIKPVRPYHSIQSVSAERIKFSDLDLTANTYINASFPIKMGSAHYQRNFEIPTTVNSVVEIQPTSDKSSDAVLSNQTNEPQIDWIGMVGSIFATVGLFSILTITGIILCAVALIMGLISIYRIKNHPDKYRGRGFALVSIAIGSIAGVFLFAYAVYTLATLV